MIEITVTVHYKGKNYQTKVIAKKEALDEEIKALALEQIRKQWYSEMDA